MRSIIFGFALCIFQGGLIAQSNVQELTNDGAWCWFSDPRAVQTSDGVIITGWVKKDGSVEAASLDLNDGSINQSILFPDMQVDDHNNPAFALLPDDRILTMYTWHSSKRGIVYHVSEKPGDVTSFSPATIIRPGLKELLTKFPRETFTYANPLALSDEDDVIYAFGRWIGYKPNMIKSTDLGRTWHSPKVIISPEVFDPGNRPYVKYASDGEKRIHLVFTDGHPRVEPFNSVYHCYYEAGAFWKTDGTKICTVDELPFAPTEATLVYKPTSSSGRAWLADIGIDENDQPVILYTRHPRETDHYYQYTYYDGDNKEWVDHEICKAGKWFPQTQEGETEREPHYHGNLTIHPANPDIVYLSRQVNERFEIEKRTTSDKGETWTIQPITTNSTYDQVRPYVPRQAKGKTAVMWMENKKYIHYTDYDTAIKYYVDDVE